MILKDFMKVAFSDVEIILKGETLSKDQITKEILEYEIRKIVPCIDNCNEPPYFRVYVRKGEK